MNVTHIGFAEPASMPRDPIQHGDIALTLVPKDAPYTLDKLLRGVLGRIPAGILNYQSAAMDAAIEAHLATKHYDIVQFEGVELFSYLSTIMKSPWRPRSIVWDWHNIESELMVRYSQHAATPFHKMYLRKSAKQLKVLERDLLANCDLHLVTSERERDYLVQIRSDIQIAVVENGVDVRYFDSRHSEQLNLSSSRIRNRILFVGTMDYHPNADGARYFCDEVWPLLHQQMPSTIFTIVGRNPPASVLDLARRQGVEVTGTVADVRPYYQEAFVVVVPLRIGGGTRLKILEAMAAGIPVVSTSQGMEGLRVEPGRHLELADTIEDFSFHVNSLRRDRLHRERLSRAGRKLVEDHYDWGAIGTHLTEVYNGQFGFKHNTDSAM
jgi:glycosyltransferase involved in cell wall biosynthesis